MGMVPRCHSITTVFALYEVRPLSNPSSKPDHLSLPQPVVYCFGPVCACGCVAAIGAGESGKSTLVKQMKIIHGDGFTQEELRSYKPTIADNLVHSMRAVLEAMGALYIDLGDQANRVHAKAVLTYVESGSQGQLTPELTAALKSLWADTGVQHCFRRSNEYQLNDSAEYFFNSIDRISSPNYMPTEQVRTKTCEQHLTLTLSVSLPRHP